MNSPVSRSDSRSDSTSRRSALSPSHSLARRTARSSGARSAVASNSCLTRAQRSLAVGIVGSGENFSTQPGFRHSPLAFHGPGGDVEHHANFFIGQAAKEPELHDLTLA